MSTVLTIPRPLERDVQRQITALFRSVGGVVRSNSQYRASGVSLGFPDLHVSFPKIGQWIWFEVKRPKAAGFDPLHSETWASEPLRPEQARFLADCVATGQPHAWGGLREAEEVLVRFGLAVRTGRALMLTPSGRAA